MALLLDALFVPWQSRVRAPGVLLAAGETMIYTAAAAKAVKLFVVPGQRVMQGDRLFQFASPDIESALRVIGARITSIHWQLEHLTPMNTKRLSSRSLSRQLGVALAEQSGLQAKRQRQIIRAPFAGVVRDLDEGLAPGRWYDRPAQP